MKTKTIKTPLLMSVTFGPTSCPSAHALKSKLLRISEAQYGLVTRRSHHRGKNIGSSSLKNKLEGLRSICLDEKKKGFSAKRGFCL